MRAVAKNLRHSDVCRLVVLMSSVAAVVMTAALAQASVARAATSYNNVGSFATPGSGQGEIGAGLRSTLAVDDATGQVFVVDRDRVKVYASSGGGAVPAYITQFGLGDLAPYGFFDAPGSIAVDQASGAIYVGDTGNNRIVKYISDHAATPTFTLDGTYAGPSIADIGDFSSPFTVDPRNGDLVVADRGLGRVARFDPSGQLVGTPFNGSGTADGVLQGPESVAVDGNGDIYLVDDRGGRPEAPGTTSVLRKFDETGAPEGAPAPIDDSPRSVAWDPKSGNVVIGGRTPKDIVPGPGPLLYVFHDGQPIATFDYPAEVGESSPNAFAFDHASGRMYAMTRVSTKGIPSVETYDPATLPDLTIGAPTDVTETEATFRGGASYDPAVVPNVQYHFEYSDDGGSSYESTSPLSGPDPNVSQPVTGLEPNQDYLVRLVATSDNGGISTPTRSFHTLSAAPLVSTGSVTDRTPDSATVRGRINPHGLQTSYHVQYGTTTDYGSRMPVDHDAVAGNGHAARSVQVGISGLTPGTTYHVRLVAKNAVGTTLGDDRTFTTPGAPDGRAYELVSPAEKGGANVDINQTGGFQSSLDGNAIAYQWKTAPGGEQDPKTSPIYPRSVAVRSATAWNSTSIDPPQLSSGSERGVAFTTTLAASPDGTKALVSSRMKLAPGGSEGDSNLYIEDLATRTYRIVATEAGPGLWGYVQGVGQNLYVDGTADFSHVLISGASGHVLLPGAPNGALYEWTPEGGLKIASRDTANAPMGDISAVGGATQSVVREGRYISQDGRRVVLPQFGTGLFVRIDGTSTVAASASHQAGDAGTVKPADYAGVTTDGRYVFMYSRDLTDDSTPGELTLYRYDVESGDLKLLTPVNLDGGWLQTSANGASVFFRSDLDLAPGASLFGNNLYVWHDDQVKLIATLDQSRDFGPIPEWLASPNGRYFAFAAYSSLTGYDNSSTTACRSFATGDPGNSCRALYRYDVQTGDLTCASCRPDGGPVTGRPTLGPPAVQFGEYHFPRVMLDDGRVFFSSPDPLSAKDTNSSRDVYAFDGDQTTLISAGTGTGDSWLADVSADGRDVFFTTPDRLVKTDDDDANDVYDARVGGGLPSQNPPPSAGECRGDDCRSGAAGPVVSPPFASEEPSDASTITEPSRKAKVVVASATFDGTILRLTVSVSGSGRIRVSGSKLIATKRTSSKAGIYHLRVPLTKSQRKLRRAGRRVKAQFKVAYTPAFGRATSVKLTRTASR